MFAVKPAAFDYKRPESVDETIGLLEQLGDEAKILAGGQSLVPLMNFRFARPGVIIDINRIPGADFINVEDRYLAIGALARHARFEHPVEEGALGNLLSKAAGYVGHAPIRARGTFCGSIAHADPAAEWCMIACALDAEIVVRSHRGRRVIGADSFFKTTFSTDLKDDELLEAVRLPVLERGTAAGFSEFSRRAGDFAIVGVVAVLSLSDASITNARVALSGVGGRPLRSVGAEKLLAGEKPSDAVFADAGQAAASEVEPIEDIHGSKDYRRDLVRVLVRRALSEATKEAGEVD